MDMQECAMADPRSVLRPKEVRVVTELSRSCCRHAGPSAKDDSATTSDTRGTLESRPHSRSPIRMLRLDQVREMTGLGKTKIYELQAAGDFPMRVKITARSVAWVEEQAGLARPASREQHWAIPCPKRTGPRDCPPGMALLDGYEAKSLGTDRSRARRGGLTSRHVQSFGSLSGRNRRNRVPCRKRFRSSLS